jgi:gliding motility-associated-like protein
MKNYKKSTIAYIFIILFILTFHSIVGAQCSFDLKADIVQHATCPSNGIIQVTLSGDEIDLERVLISISSDNGINDQVSENGFRFEALLPGEYTITARSVCKSTQEEVRKTVSRTVLSEYISFSAPLGSYKRSSLNCLHSGMISIDMSKGRLPYKVEITSKPAEYTGETVFSCPSPGLYSFDGLAPGNYVFIASDDCGYTYTLNVTVDKIANDFPSDLYDYFYPYGCDKAYANESGTSHEYWAYYREFYEIALTLDETKDYKSPSQYMHSQYIDLTEPYNDLYAAKKTVKVYLKLKNTECEKLVDDVPFAEIPQNGISFSAEILCGKYTLSFGLNNEYALCPPFQWTIQDNAKGEIIYSNPNELLTFETQTAEGLSYNTDYTLTVTDRNGTGISITQDFSYEHINPSIAGYWASELFLLNYNLYYDVYDICPPYKIEVSDENDNLLTTIENLTNPSDIIPGLEYNKLYKIKVIDPYGNFAEFEYSAARPEEIFCDEENIEYCTIKPLCDSYSIKIDKPIEIKVPYKWSVTDKDGSEVAKGTDQDHWITGLQYLLKYTVTFTDDFNTVYQIIPENSVIRPVPYLFDIAEYNYQCNDYQIQFRIKNMLCPPYKIEVSDGRTFEYIPLQYNSVTLEYDKNYTIKITNSEGDAITPINWSKTDDYNLLPYFGMTRNDDVKCHDYEFIFEIQNIICFPYKWEVFDDEGESVYREEGLNELKGEHRVRLDFNKNYRIVVTDNKGHYVDRYQKSDSEYSGLSFDSRIEASKCVSESYRGYIDIFGQLNIGANVHFVSGPQTPVYSDITLTENITDFYPFSQIYTNCEDVPIIQGNYVFEITDDCGEIHTLNILYSTDFEARGFSYIKDETTDVCQGITRIYPRGQIYHNNEPVSTWFKLVEAPGSVPTGEPISGKDLISYFSFSLSGRYVIEIREFPDECGIDRIIIDYEDIYFALDGRTSYVCETGTIGHIRVQARGGQLPYTYTLYNEDMSLVPDVAPNSTGAFEYGAFGEKYIVKIQDACGSIPPLVEVPITTLDNLALLRGKTDFCKGETIELSCLILGATEYVWSGPLDFSADTRQISIPAEHSGKYKVNVKPFGCDKFFSDSVTITVHEAPEPNISDPYLCVAENGKYSLSATPEDAKHSIKWYDAYKEPMDKAPEIDLSEIRNYVFYVTQTKDEFGCTTEKKVEVTIGLPPEKNANATGWGCANEEPGIIVTDVVDGYVYTVYSDAEATNQITTFVGTAETMTMTLPVIVTDNTNFYLKTATASGCTLPQSIVEFQVDVDKINILPETLPVYTHGIPYYAEITSNATEPVFSHTGNAVTGITISPEGIISGTVPESAGREETTFTVTVTDAQTGCKASVEYLMRTCEPMPYLIKDIVEHCEGVPAEPLQAVPIAGNTLQWYDAEKNALDEAPVPKTNVGDDQIFFVSQVNATLGCEGEKAQVRVVINPAPVIDCPVSADKVCFQSSPSILLEEMNEKFTYSIYSDNTLLNKLGSLTGTSSGIVGINEILENNKTYYVRVSDLLGCSSLNWKEVPVEVIKLYIEPDKIPPYIKNIDYEQLLVSNAQSPIFTVYDGNLPDGLTLNTSGLIYGNVPNYYRDIANIVAVKVQDANGCVAVKEYSFEGNLFVSYIITPNGDGVNDVFMMGHQLIVFDRLGVEMYRGNNGWNGTYKGKPVADDIYFYKLEYINPQGKQKILTGYVGVHN